MRINDKNGKVDIELIKAEVRLLLEGSYVVERIARNVEPGPAQELMRSAENFRAVAAKYGGQYIDANGQLAEAEHKKPDLATAPPAAQQEAAQNAALPPVGGEKLFDNSDPLKGTGI